MKKLIATVIMTTALVATPVLADVPDISTLTGEELLALHQTTTASLIAFGKTATIQPGRYTVGEDLPAGKYDISLPEGKTDAFGIYKSASSNYQDAGLHALFSDDADRVIHNVTLSDGNIIEVTNTWTITTATGTGIVFE